MSSLNAGAFVLSLDLDHAALHGEVSKQGSAGSKLIGMISKHGIEATWSLSSLERSFWLESIQAIKPTQEIALLADVSWIAGSRVEFAAGLIKSMVAARTSGLSPSTLAWKNNVQPAHLDLLVKQGITAVRPLGIVSEPAVVSGWRGWVNGGSTTAHGPQALRWGLWQIAADTDLLSGGFKEVRRAIDRAADEHEVIHLAIDVATITTRDLEVLDQTLAYVAEHRAKNQISDRSLSALAQQLTWPRQAAPAGSILRRTAA